MKCYKQNKNLATLIIVLQSPALKKMRKIDMVTSKPGYTHDKYVLMEKKKLHNSDSAEYLYIKAWYELHAKKGMIVTPSWCAQYTTALDA